MKYVAAFASTATLSHFCRTEFLTVAQTIGVDVTPVTSVPATTVDSESPAWEVNDENDASDDPFYVFESDASFEALKAVAERCILLRSLHILLQAAPSLEALYEWRQRSLMPSLPAAVPPPQGQSVVVVGEDEASFAMDDYVYAVETVGKRYSEADKRVVLDAVVAGNVVLQGKRVNWKSPARRFLVLIQHHGEIAAGGGTSSPPVLRVLHVVLLVSGGRVALLAKYDLRKRPYLGTTSMPPEESLLMANLACVRPGAYVMDPFCGTGSLLVAAAHCGAHTFGADADGRAMRAGTRKGASSPQLQQQRRLALSNYDESELATLTPEERVLPTMRTNFKLYKLPPPDCARMNFSAWKSNWRASRGTLDAILSDPPYGLREPRKKVSKADDVAGTVRDNTVAAQTRQQQPYVSEYSTNEVVLDLVLFAAEHLCVGGRLAFWHPTTDNYTDDELPTHPSLRLVTNLPQRLSLKFVRRLVTMEKVAPVPQPPPSRLSCAPLKLADDMRTLMDATALPDNADYTSYRSRLQRRRDAAQRYHDETKKSNEGSSDAGHAKEKRPRGKAPAQEEIVANREKNIRIRQEKQEVSHLANLLRSRQRGGE